MKTFTALIAFLQGAQVDGEQLLKDVEDVIYVNAAKIRWRLDRDTVTELVSIYVTDAVEIPKPVDNPLAYMHAHAKRIIYASAKKGIPLDKIPPLFGIAQAHEIDIDLLAPIAACNLHSEIKATYDELVGAMAYEQATALAATQCYLGQLISAAIFHTLAVGKEAVRLEEDEGSRNCLNLSPREEEVLLGVICAKLNKKWAPPAYILMRDTFFLALFSFMGSAMAPGYALYFRHVFKSSRVFVHLSKLLRGNDEGTAERLCGKRFGLRVRDVHNRHTHITRLLRRYDAYAAIYCRQLRADAKRAAAIVEGGEILRESDEPAGISSELGITDEALGEDDLRELECPESPESAAGESGVQAGSLQDGSSSSSRVHGSSAPTNGPGGHGEDDAQSGSGGSVRASGKDVSGKLEQGSSVPNAPDGP